MQKINHKEFLKNFSEMKSFIDALNSKQVINNYSRLIQQVAISYQNLIFYKKHKISKCLYKVGGQDYVLKISGTTQEGDSESLDFEEVHFGLVQSVFKEIGKAPNKQNFEELLRKVTIVLQDKNVQIEDKLSLMDLFSATFQDGWENFFIFCKNAVTSAGLNAYIRVLKAALLEMESVKINFQDAHKSLCNLFRLRLKILIAQNNYSGLTKQIHDEIIESSSISDGEKFDAALVIPDLVFELIKYNNLFQLERKETVRSIVEHYKEYLDENVYRNFLSSLKFDPTEIELRNLSVRMENPSFVGISDDAVCTEIRLVLPGSLDKQQVVEFDDSISVVFSKVSHLFEDPVFRFMDSANLNINGLPLTFFADSIGDLNNSVFVYIRLEEFYHPDFDITQTGEIVFIDENGSLDFAHGGDFYHPHKDKIVEVLWGLREAGKIPFELESKINTDLISNFQIAHKSGEKILYNAAYLITNYRAYADKRIKFLENQRKNYLDPGYLEIKELIQDTVISDRGTFLSFCTRLISLTLKKAVELGGSHIYFWSGDVPQSEPNVQPLIYNDLRFLFEIKGIQITREVVAAGGKCDYFVHYVRNDVEMKVCIELKNAHHQQLEHGLVTQLPSYINDIGHNQGIFLVLWYKGLEFDLPKKHKNKNALITELQAKKPKKYDIDVVVIDCSKKLSPSNPKSQLIDSH